MRYRNILPAFALIFAVTLFSPSASAQFSVCEDGNGALDTAKPVTIPTEEIIQKFAAKEAIAKAARAK